MTEKKPERTLELHVDIDARIEEAWKAITEGAGIANWLEGKKDKFHVGYWFSVYDEARAKALETPAKRAFRRIHESLPGQA